MEESSVGAAPPVARDCARIGFDVVEARGVSLAYGESHALRQVDLRCVGGEIVGVSGHNGAGKTSLFRVLATLQRPTRGEVCFDGVPATSIRPLHALRGNIGMLAHASFLYPDLTGEENLLYYGRLCGLTGRGLDRMVQWALETVGMDAQRGRLVRACSRGMVQRLSFARLLLQDARLWLLDEPMTGLDVESRTRLEALLLHEARQGRVILVVAHEEELLDRVAGRRYELSRGRIRELGPSTAAPGGCSTARGA